MSEDQKLSVLDQLEQEFEGGREPDASSSGRKSKNKKSPGKIVLFPNFLKKKKTIILCLAVVLILCLIVGKVFLTKKNSNEVQKETPGFLTAEEKKDWGNKEVDKNEIFIYVNTNLELKDGNKVQLQLANPPYCAYPAKIDITDTENKTIYYTSEVLKPGQSLEEVMLKDIPEKKGTYDIVIRYTFYSESGDTEVGEHTVNASLLIK